MVLNQIIPVTNRVPARSQTGLKVCNLVNRHLVYLKGLNVQLHRTHSKERAAKEKTAHSKGNKDPRKLHSN